MLPETIAPENAKGQAVDTPTFTDQMRASHWIEQAAFALYQAERLQFPERPTSEWSDASPIARTDARYRAIAAHMRGNPKVKAVLVERLASALALADGVIWPACHGPIKPADTDSLRYQAEVARRRQLYRHKARLMVTATNHYLDLDAVVESEEVRDVILARAKLQHMDDAAVVTAHKESLLRMRRVVPIAEAPTGDGRY